MKKGDVNVASTNTPKETVKVAEDKSVEVTKEVKVGLEGLSVKTRAQLTIMPNGMVVDHNSILTDKEKKILRGEV